MGSETTLMSYIRFFSNIEVLYIHESMEGLIIVDANEVVQAVGNNSEPVRLVARGEALVIFLLVTENNV